MGIALKTVDHVADNMRSAINGVDGQSYGDAVEILKQAKADWEFAADSKASAKAQEYFRRETETAAQERLSENQKQRILQLKKYLDEIRTKVGAYLILIEEDG